MEAPSVELNWQRQYRVISSEFPPINFFEGLTSPDLMEELYYIESLTNDRLRDEAGNIALVAPEDRVCGPGSSPLMAAFTHASLACPSRFSDGSYGVYYAAKSLNTAVAESKYHRQRFLVYTQEEAGEIDMRVYIGKVLQPLRDVRGAEFERLHATADWQPGQVFGRKLKAENAWGIVYRSVRDSGGECIAALRPPAVSIPKQGPHLSYVWDGQEIVTVYEKTVFQ